MAPSASIVTKLKVQLKLSIARLRMVQQRDEAASKVQRRAMAQLLDQGKIESARIRVENIIRSDIQVELYELLELYCELLLARAGLLEGPTCDPGLEEAAKSVIYAAGKTEIKELQAVRQLLGEKFGKEFILAGTTNSDGKVSEKVLKKLSVTPPREELVVGYLEEIARAYGVSWPRREEKEESPGLADEAEAEEGADEGQTTTKNNTTSSSSATTATTTTNNNNNNNTTTTSNAGANNGSASRSSQGTSNPSQPTLPGSSADNAQAKAPPKPTEYRPSTKPATGAAGSAKRPAAGGSKAGGNPKDGIPSVDDLAKRFAALKR